jgi:hypothetical protein
LSTKDGVDYRRRDLRIHRLLGIFLSFESLADVGVVEVSRLGARLGTMTTSKFVERYAQEEKRRFGSQGGASKVRVIDLASVDKTALLEQLDSERERSQRRATIHAARRGFQKR